MGPWKRVRWLFRDVEWPRTTERQETLAQRGISFSQLKDFLRKGEGVERMDDKKDYGEERWEGLAEIEIRILFFAFTVRLPYTAIVFSMHNANARKQKEFEKGMQSDEDTE